MKEYHELIHARDTVKTYNIVVNSISQCILLLKDRDITDTVLNETLENLKLYITDGATSAKTRYINVAKFINSHISYDLSMHTTATQYDIISRKTESDNFCSAIVTAVAAPQINTKTKLAGIAVVSNPLTLLAPVEMHADLHYTIMMNDWLDSTSLIVRNIHFNTGQPIEWTDEKKRATIKSMLSQFVPFDGFQFPVEWADDIALMRSVKNWILANIDSLPLADIGAYVDANIEPVPLIRRVNFPT